ncbi:MAG: hypothetical protein PHI68_05495, partial [Candidatus Cloacimonetes bacterium]|nr:hypothetical protein [Candidatus Cloacimonadota bacterium]
MNTSPFNQPETISINCYNIDDTQSLEIAYSDLLVFTDESQHTEGWMRYHSGAGFWVSPVFYKYSIGRKHVVLLNKSGCLMSVYVTNPTPVVEWKTDLRSSERNLDPSSFKFEFIATPVLLDGKIYVGSTLLNTTGIRFPGNHSVLSYHNATNKTMLFTINNENSNMYGDGVADCYPSNSAEYDISSRNINLSYVAYNNAYTNPTIQVSQPDVKWNRQSWGGIATY